MDTIQTVCELCAHGSHLEMEGCRLLASLVKYSNSQGEKSSCKTAKLIFGINMTHIYIVLYIHVHVQSYSNSVKDCV